jgi:hypothetical protein
VKISEIGVGVFSLLAVKGRKNWSAANYSNEHELHDLVWGAPGTGSSRLDRIHAAANFLFPRGFLCHPTPMARMSVNSRTFPAVASCRGQNLPDIGNHPVANGVKQRLLFAAIGKNFSGFCPGIIMPSGA